LESNPGKDQSLYSKQLHFLNCSFFNRNMELIWWIQTLFPPALVASICPLIIIGCLLLAFGEWLYPKWRSAGLTYALSLLAVPLASQAVNLDWRESAIVGGIVVPAICGLLLVVDGSMRTLNAPRHSLGRSAQGRSVQMRSFWLRLTHSLPNSFVKLGRGLLGSCVGGVLGFALGLLVSLVVLALLSLLALLPVHDSTGEMNERFITAVLNGGIYTFGSLGLVVGGCIGLGQLNLQRLHQRVLITIVICSALMMQTARNIFQIPYLSRSVTFEVSEHQKTLMVRCRTYRSADWVWIGFNGLYDVVAIFIILLALLRGTWATLGLGISLILIIGVVWTWYSLTRLLNYTTITVSPTHLNRWDAPLFSLRFPVRLPFQQIAMITSSVPAAPSKLRRSLQSTEYQVCAVLMNGRRVPLLQRLEKQEEAIFVEETIDRFLSTRMG
jgi:hypothetical protein